MKYRKFKDLPIGTVHRSMTGSAYNWIKVSETQGRFQWTNGKDTIDTIYNCMPMCECATKMDDFWNNVINGPKRLWNYIWKLFKKKPKKKTA